jgi:glycosyltransferase involved in cell wall biosynthesis
MDINHAFLSGLKRQSVSIVMPVLNEAASLALFLPHIAEALNSCAVDWEIVVVDDGGNDHLSDVLDAFEKKTPRCNVQLVKLSRNFGKEAALTAGLNAARGDAMISMDGDGQHPALMIPRMIRQWRDGYDMVIGVQRERRTENHALVFAKKLFYRFLQTGERFSIPPNAGDFRLMDRRVVNALLQLPERTRFMKGLYAWVGFKTTSELFDADERAAGATKFRLGQLLNLASMGITSFSMKPLRMVSAIGIIISFASLAYGLYVMVQTLLFGNPLSGWATLASGITLLSGIQLVCLGVIAEYLGRVFEESKQRPLYIVDETTDHSVLQMKRAVEEVML